ncbi:unnamed protein product [Natator depressus]
MARVPSLPRGGAGFGREGLFGNYLFIGYFSTQAAACLGGQGRARKGALRFKEKVAGSWSKVPVAHTDQACSAATALGNETDLIVSPRTPPLSPLPRHAPAPSLGTVTWAGTEPQRGQSPSGEEKCCPRQHRRSRDLPGDRSWDPTQLFPPQATPVVRACPCLQQPDQDTRFICMGLGVTEPGAGDRPLPGRCCHKPTRKEQLLVYCRVHVPGVWSSELRWLGLLDGQQGRRVYNH